MFNLDREVASWTAAVHAERCQSVAGKGVAELSDHLYCEIDRGRAEGLSDEEAFHAAIALLGSASELTSEEAKNRSALGTVCKVAAKLDGRAGSTSPEDRRLILGHAVIWAALMIAVALLLKKTGDSGQWVVLSTVIFIPLWMASEQILRAALRRKHTRA